MPFILRGFGFREVARVMTGTNGRLPLLLLPGLVCDERVYAGVQKALTGVAVPVVGDITTREDMGALAADLLARAPQRFVLAGLSMGGYCALEIVHRAPARVAALALIDTSARPDTDASRAAREQQIARGRNGAYMDVVDELVPRWVHPSRADDEEVAGIVRSMARDNGPATFERQQRAIMSRADSRSRLCAIRCPTVVLAGAQDALLPREVHEEMAQAIPGATLTLVPDCGHLAPLERPQAVAAALAGLVASIG